MTDQRKPQGWLTYPRNHEHMVGRVFGPSHLGEFWKAVEAAYDPATDRTRVGLVIASRDDIAADLAGRA
jgi:hypothetical protein